MNIKDVGEFGLIEIIRKSQPNDADGIRGIGDDCAVVPSAAGKSYVITTDMLVEGKHFIPDRTTPSDLGYKSLAVNVSDIISMGAEPKYSFLSLSIDPETKLEWFEKFMEGYESFGIPLLGGDTTAGNKGNMVINITMVGEVETHKIKYRSGAKNGDVIAVTGSLGSSAAGLRAIMNGHAEKYPELAKTHFRPEINIEGGIWLGNREAVHAMTDISDGIASDLLHICENSNCGAVINLPSLPISEETAIYCRLHGLDAVSLATEGGEDYSLLLTVEKKEFQEIKKNYPGNLYEIGYITEGNSIKYMPEPKGTGVKTGFRHF